METILPNIISTVGAILGSLIGTMGVIYGKSKKETVKEAVKEQYQNDRMDRLIEEQKKIKLQLKTHNGYAEKFSHTSTDIALIKEKQLQFNKIVEDMKKDIEDLKSKCYKMKGEQ